MRPYAIALVLVAALTSQAAWAADDDAFAAMNRKFETAIRNHDTASWLSLYADDAVLIPVGQPIVQGKEDLKKWGEGAAKVWNTLEIKEQQTRVDGSFAWQPGTWSGNINMPDGKAMDVAGNYLTILRKDGEDWKIIADTWNVNPPHQEPPMTGSSTQPNK
jgi:uncharacterized protein (TIGR02246 family)